jgi:(E)-4-hydroxy-3-methylbut-2-enyl-diphosphate synthase
VAYREAKPETIPPMAKPSYDPFAYKRRESLSLGNTGGRHVPVVVADFSYADQLSPKDLRSVGYTYDPETDKWQIGDAAADFVYTGSLTIPFALPGTLRVVVDQAVWTALADKEKYLPLYTRAEYLSLPGGPDSPHIVLIDAAETFAWEPLTAVALRNQHLVLAIRSSHPHAMPSVRQCINHLADHGVRCPVILCVESHEERIDQQLIHFATEAGALLLDGMGDGTWLRNTGHPVKNLRIGGRTYLEVRNNEQFLNNTAFSILQATRTRISKTEYISCPSCGRTLFDLQETTAKIRAVTHHLKGVKIAIMGCIVNGPGEMADADFGYVGSGPGKITLYKGKEIVKRNVDSQIAVEELIRLLKEHDAWVEPSLQVSPA